jgi:predicted PurR-regulated permease PerM
MTVSKSSPSPKWSATTKLVVGLTVIALIVALLINFRSIMGPLLLAFILAYLLHPIAVNLSETSRLSWRWAVNLVFLTMVVLVIGFLFVAGLTLVEQLQILIRVIQNFIVTLPDLAENLSSQSYNILGLFEVNLAQIDIEFISQELIGALQTVLGQAGTIISGVAASAAGLLGWGFFILIIAYFLLADAGQVSFQLFRIEIPEYEADLRRLGAELMDIWNAFLRGQLVISILVILIYLTLLNILGVRYSLGLAILAGTSRFVPYVGPLVTVLVTALVALLQGSNYFGLVAWQFALLVVVITLVVDQFFDNLIAPRFLVMPWGCTPPQCWWRRLLLLI